MILTLKLDDQPVTVNYSDRPQFEFSRLWRVYKNSYVIVPRSHNSMGTSSDVFRDHQVITCLGDGFISNNYSSPYGTSTLDLIRLRRI
jgi:hypothetical protein